MKKKRYNAPMLYETKLEGSCETSNTHRNAPMLYEPKL